MKKDGWVYLYQKFELKKKKNMIIRCVCKHPKHEVSDLTNNYISPLLDKLSNENKDHG